MNQISLDFMMQYHTQYTNFAILLDFLCKAHLNLSFHRGEIYSQLMMKDGS